MANVGYGYVQGSKDYINLEDALGLSLTVGKTYSVQILGEGMFCEASTKPTAGGTKYNGEKDKPFYYTKENGVYLWAKLMPNKEFYVNFAG